MDSYTKLAKFAIEKYIKTGKKITPLKNLPKEMLDKKAGVFVSIHKTLDKTHQRINPSTHNSELRGCIGTFLPTKKNIAQEIINNSISACSSDSRFAPITSNELSNLKISIDILDKPEPIQELSSLDPKKYGVIVKSKTGKTGLLLPNLLDVDTPEIQVAIARQKAGIAPTEDVYLYRFEVKKHT